MSDTDKMLEEVCAQLRRLGLGSVTNSVPGLRAWWDKRREKLCSEAAIREEARRSGLSKLTPEEKRALDLPEEDDRVLYDALIINFRAPKDLSPEAAESLRAAVDRMPDSAFFTSWRHLVQIHDLALHFERG